MNPKNQSSQISNSDSEKSIAWDGRRHKYSPSKDRFFPVIPGDELDDIDG